MRTTPPCGFPISRARWCCSIFGRRGAVPAKIEIPWFIEFENVYKNRGFAVLGVSMDDDGWRAVKPFLREKTVNYRVVLGDGPVARMYGGVESLPTTFIIDREGRIAAEHVRFLGPAQELLIHVTIAKILSSKWAKVGLFLACAVPFARLALPVLAALNAVPDAVATAISQNSFFVTIGPNTVESSPTIPATGRCGFC
jgi:hypothetical protein